jgi:hypothetical protein
MPILSLVICSKQLSRLILFSGLAFSQTQTPILGLVIFLQQLSPIFLLGFGKSAKPEQLIDYRQLLRFGKNAKPEEIVDSKQLPSSAPSFFIQGG